MSEPSAATRLPNEILERIFIEMEPSNKLYSCALVSRKWNQLATPNLYSTVTLRHEDDAVLFSETASLHKPSLTTHTRELFVLGVHTPRITLVRIVRCDWPKLRVLHVARMTRDWWSNASDFPFLRQLVHLDVNGLNLPYFKEPTYEELHHLRLGWYRKTEFKLPYFPNLRSLSLDHLELKATQPNGILLAVLAACPNLRHLEYICRGRGGTRESTDFWALLDAHSENLLSLRFEESSANLNPRILRSIESLSKVRTLQMKFTGEFPFPMSFPETLAQMELTAESIRAEDLTTLLVGLGQGSTLPFIENIPFLRFKEIVGDAGSLANYKKERDIAWQNLKARGIRLRKARDISYYGSIWSEYP